MGLKQQIRRALRRPGKYAQAVFRWKRLTFDEAPPIFGNAKPKSGSHLLLQILDGFCRIAPYAYVEADPVRTIRKDGGRRTADDILADLRRLPGGVIGWGYLEPTPQNIAFLCQRGRVNYFIYRDPRDMLISHVFFATDMYEEHGMHAYYQSLSDFGERLTIAIAGVDRDGLHMANVRQRYEGVFGWLEQPGLLCLRFEDLVNDREATLNTMLNEVEKTGYRFPVGRERAIAALVEAVQPHKSHTFRSGRSGEWKEYFTDEHKKLFKEVAGDLLVQLGYEKNNDW